MKAVFGKSEKEMADQEERVAPTDRFRRFVSGALDVNGFDVNGFDVRNLMSSPVINSTRSSCSSSCSSSSSSPIRPTRPKLSPGPGRNAKRVVLGAS